MGVGIIFCEGGATEWFYIIYDDRRLSLVGGLLYDQGSSTNRQGVLRVTTGEGGQSLCERLQESFSQN